jgi:hypothetical protein
MLRYLPTATPETHLRFAVQGNFIGPVPNHSKHFQRHSPHKTVCFGQSKVICFVPNLPQLLCLVMGSIK